jgi:ATP-GRASP peptide maturase of grasp-with-spasm system
MILIVSDEKDISTTEVLRWLNFYNAPWIRVNTEDKIIIHSVAVNEFEFEIEGKTKRLSSDRLTAYWYRRGHFTISFATTFSISKEQEDGRDLLNYLNRELDLLKRHIINIIESKFGIGSFYENSSINKLINLRLAEKVGLDIPLTKVLRKKKNLDNLLLKKELITKPITDGFIRGSENRYYGFTSEVKTDDLDDVENDFFPSLFQEKLNKKFEIRIFYLAGNMYSTAIFSQRDPQTAVDFRNYNSSRPNRTPNVELNDSVKELICKFMRTVGYKSGSLDFVVTTDDRVVFLEVNPIGQFEQVSVPGNYFIEKKIAEYLINENF